MSRSNLSKRRTVKRYMKRSNKRSNKRSMKSSNKRYMKRTNKRRTMKIKYGGSGDARARPALLYTGRVEGDVAANAARFLPEEMKLRKEKAAKKAAAEKAEQERVAAEEAFQKERLAAEARLAEAQRLYPDERWMWVEERDAWYLPPDKFKVWFRAQEERLAKEKAEKARLAEKARRFFRAEEARQTRQAEAERLRLEEEARLAEEARDANAANAEQLSRHIARTTKYIPEAYNWDNLRLSLSPD